MRGYNTDGILNQLVSKKKLCEAYVKLTELQKGPVRILQTLRSAERKLQLKRQTCEWLNYIVIKINHPVRKKTQCHRITTNVKKPKVNEKK